MKVLVVSHLRPGSFDVDPNTSGGADFFAENGLDTTKGPASVYYRFNNVGTRDTTVKDFQADFKAGLDGTLYTDSFGEVIWEAGYHLNFSNSNEVGTGYVFGSAASNLVESGQFVNGEFSADATNQLSAVLVVNPKWKCISFLAAFNLT